MKFLEIDRWERRGPIGERIPKYEGRQAEGYQTSGNRPTSRSILKGADLRAEEY